jgi:hypothetical protein
MPKNSERIEAIEWTLTLYEHAKKHAPRVAFENPVGVLPIKPTQYIQPYQFGHPEDVWRTLPKKEAQRIHMLPPSKDRWKIRSETYTGIAEAMASQWTS